MAKLLIPNPNTPITDNNGNLTQEWRKWAESVTKLPEKIVDAQTIINNATPRLYLATDGEAVSFGGTFGVAPSRIEYRATGLPALAVGEVYDIKPLNKTALGFDSYAKIRVAGAITNQTTGAGSFDNGLGYYTAEKPITDDAYNQIYKFDIDCVLNVSGVELLGDGTYQGDYQGSFRVKVFTGGSWVDVEDIIVTVSINTGASIPPSTYAYSNAVATVTITQDIGMVVGAEFGIKALGSASVTAFNEVTYQTQAFGATTSMSPRLIEWQVYA